MGNALPCSLCANRFEGFRNARGRRISILAVAHRLVDSVDDVSRSLKVEIERITDIQRENLVSLLDDFVGDARQITDGVANILESGCSNDFAGWKHCGN